MCLRRRRLGTAQMNVEFELIEKQVAVLSASEYYVLLLYRIATYVTFNVIDDAAMLAFGLS
jgi:hypothetical protein